MAEFATKHHRHDCSNPKKHLFSHFVQTSVYVHRTIKEVQTYKKVENYGDSFQIRIIFHPEISKF